MILGTAGYMAPEQARGKPVDKRADIWAFGVVLYEMLTGQRLFDGETISDTLAAVLTKDLDFQPAPPKVRRLLARCLRKRSQAPTPRHRRRHAFARRSAGRRVPAGSRAVVDTPARLDRIRPPFSFSPQPDSPSYTSAKPRRRS